MSSLKFDWLSKLTFKYSQTILQFETPASLINAAHLPQQIRSSIFTNHVLVLLFVVLIIIFTLKNRIVTGRATCQPCSHLILPSSLSRVVQCMSVQLLLFLRCS